jgi:para-nitrobenzyl esterase
MRNGQHAAQGVVSQLWISSIVALCLPLVNAPASAQQSFTVAINTGLVIGSPATADNGEAVEKFLGIPYAAPPVGALRWVAPEPPLPLQKPLVANQFGPGCMQATAEQGNQSGPTTPPGASEDCLTLNVWTPVTALKDSRVWRPNGPKESRGVGRIGTLPLARLPVMVFIHGGSYMTGWSGFPLYEGTNLAARGNVVVVSMNYRLGAFGFLAQSALSATNPAGVSGNYGLLDQRAALQWVQQNIAGFGGDANRVMVFGESAGGGSVCAHLTSPGSAGLFSRAGAESGFCGQPLPTLTQAIAAPGGGDSFAAAIGCSGATNVAACERSVPASIILVASQTAQFGPVVDGPSGFLPLDPLAAFKAGQFHRMPVLFGGNQDEGTLFVALKYLLHPGPNPVPPDPTAYAAAIASFMNPVAASNPSIVQQVANLYPFTNYSSPTQGVAAVYGDELACYSEAAIKALSTHTLTYGYQFAAQNVIAGFPPIPGFTFGTYHGSELPFVFDNLLTPAVAGGADLSALMIRYWSSFASFGLPLGTPFWPPFVASQGNLLELREFGQTAVGRSQHNCVFWDGINDPA